MSLPKTRMLTVFGGGHAANPSEGIHCSRNAASVRIWPLRKDANKGLVLALGWRKSGVQSKGY